MYLSDTPATDQDVLKAMHEGNDAFWACKGYDASPYGNLLWSRRSQELHRAWCVGYDAAKAWRDERINAVLEG